MATSSYTAKALTLWLTAAGSLLGDCRVSRETDRADAVAQRAAIESLPLPGYDGSVPSPAAQAALEKLKGRRFQPTGGLLGNEELVIVDGSLEVIPNPITEKGPVILLERPDARPAALRLSAGQGEDGRFWLPVVTDGDAADLIRRVTGAVPTDLKGRMSEAYRRTIAVP